MNTSTLLNNLKYITLGLIVALAIGVTHASFTLPTTTPPGANVATPLHTGPDQVKDAGLSVNTFLATQNAAFKQQTFLNGTVFGGKPGDASSTVSIGDSTAPANVAVNGNLSAATFLQSSSVANTSASNLCATADGTIVTCGAPIVAGTPPSINQKGSSVYQNNVDNQVFQVGSSVTAGNKYYLGVYSYNVYVTAVAGDTPESIAEKMIAAINATTPAQWRSGTSTGVGVPADGTPGFPPSAQPSILNPAYIITTVDSVHQMGGSATSS